MFIVCNKIRGSCNTSYYLFIQNVCFLLFFFNLISPFAIAAGDIRDSLIVSISMNDK